MSSKPKPHLQHCQYTVASNEDNDNMTTTTEKEENESYDTNHDNSDSMSEGNHNFMGEKPKHNGSIIEIKHIETDDQSFHNDVDIGEPLCHFNSANLLEIAVNMGSASTLLGLNIDDLIQVELAVAKV